MASSLWHYLVCTPGRRLSEVYPIVKTKKSANEERLLDVRTERHGRWWPILKRRRLPLLMLGPKECTYPLHRLAWRLIILPRPLLVFDRPPQPCDNDVIKRPSPTSQAQLHPRCGQTSRQVETGQLGPLSTVAHVRSSPRRACANASRHKPTASVLDTAHERPSRLNHSSTAPRETPPPCSRR